MIFKISEIICTDLYENYPERQKPDIEPPYQQVLDNEGEERFAIR